jgi:hypothetical protein
MVTLVSGLPGSGKTYFNVATMINELGLTDRFVVTTCQDLKLPRLNAYLQERFAERVIDLDKRLLVLTKEEAPQFFRYRSGGLVLPPPPETKDGRKIRQEEFVLEMEHYFKPIQERPEWSLPVSYFVMEAHDYFNADRWMERGMAVQYYVSKHRHLHDEIVFETQSPGMLDNKMRVLVEEHHDIVNNYRRRLGPFRRRGNFERRVYFRIAKPSSVPERTVEFPLDPKGVGSCYHTTGALGILDRGAEQTSHRPKGLPWWTIWVGAAAVSLAIGAVAFTVPKLLGKGLGAMVGSVGTSFNASLGTQVGPGAKQAPVSQDTEVPGVAFGGSSGPERTGRDGLPERSASGAMISRRLPSPARQLEVVVTGYTVRGQAANVFLSDGQVWTESSPEMRGARIERQTLVLADGTRIPIRSSGTFHGDSSVVSSRPGPVVASREEPRGDSPAVNTSRTRDRGSWQLDDDGVLRLKTPDTLR